MATKDEKRALYRRIVHSSREWIVLERMRVHGFWPRREPIPEDPEEEKAERAKIGAELEELTRRHCEVKDPKKALEDERRRRWDESKKRRAEKKKAREAAALKRRQRWSEEKKRRLSFLGPEVSAGIGRDENARSDAERLGALHLPVVHTGAELAAAMGIELSTLKWLAYHRRGAALVHYHRYDIPKKTGGRRHISAPKPKLAAAQRYILEHILARIPATEEAHGFVAGRNITSNAAPHVGREIVVNVDIEDFFPTIGFRRVKGLFRKLGYSEQVAVVLSLLVTEPPRIPASFDGKGYFVALGARRLPQGASTSPAITNLICNRLDRRLRGLLAPLGIVYTRYADDLTFSGDGLEVGALLGLVRRLLREEGFRENRKKTRVMRRGGRQEATGLVVNDKISVPRREIRELRAILHNCARFGLESQNRHGHPDFAAHLRGRVAFVSMVDPERGKKLGEALRRALGTDRK